MFFCDIKFGCMGIPSIFEGSKAKIDHTVRLIIIIIKNKRINFDLFL